MVEITSGWQERIESLAKSLKKNGLAANMDDAIKLAKNMMMVQSPEQKAEVKLRSMEDTEEEEIKPEVEEKPEVKEEIKEEEKEVKGEITEEPEEEKEIKEDAEIKQEIKEEVSEEKEKEETMEADSDLVVEEDTEEVETEEEKEETKTEPEEISEEKQKTLARDFDITKEDVTVSELLAEDAENIYKDKTKDSDFIDTSDEIDIVEEEKTEAREKRSEFSDTE